MPNPPKPVEQKRLVGNPGKRAMPSAEDTITLYSGRCEPLAPLGEAGQRLWDLVFGEGELWVSPRTDVAWLQVALEGASDEIVAEAKQMASERWKRMMGND